jgi:hypothetical protein
MNNSLVLMPILLREYGDNKGKNLVALSLAIAAGILLTTLGVSVIMGVNESRSREESMIQPVILEKLEELPESLQTEVLHYIEFLIEKQGKNSTQDKPKKRRVAGTMKGMFVLPLPDDFDEPLEDMKEYME